jgi:hypothetical protein
MVYEARLQDKTEVSLAASGWQKARIPEDNVITDLD